LPHGGTIAIKCSLNIRRVLFISGENIATVAVRVISGCSGILFPLDIEKKIAILSTLNKLLTICQMFIDAVNIRFRAGNGGNGIVSWRHEARIAK
jgi:hypothetical protein